MRLGVDGTPKTLSFDARNLQFTSLYMPQHAQGYETETAALLDLLVVPDAVFYDVGSNWGYYALWIAGRKGFKGLVHAFEPLPKSFRDLADLVSRSGLSPKIICHNIGLSDRSGDARMIIPDGLHSGLATVSSNQSGATIAIRRLDDLQIPDPNVIKMDVEDHEIQTLRGGTQILSRARPHIVFESFWGRQAPAARMASFKFLADLGYVFFQPSWVEASVGNGDYVEHRDWRAGKPSILALVSFEPAQRFLLKEHLNVLACHGDKIRELEGLFPDVGGRLD